MKYTLFFAFVASLGVSAAAQPAANTQSQAVGTNFPALANYPAPDCVKPGTAPARPITTDAMDVDRYNAMVANYNKKGHAYVVCINAYIRNADNDMDLIRKKSRDAADAANQANQ